MESYKHSCPFCGQHIEYTAGYCGKQMQCPICGQTVTFPALPPGRSGPTLRVKALERKPERKWKWKLPTAFTILLNFQHWNVVAQCAVPFLIIAALLAGAVFVKKKLTDEPAPVAAPVVQVDPEAWQRTTDLTKAEQDVKARMNELNAAHAKAEMAERLRRQVQNLEPFQRKSVEEQAQVAQKELESARQRFDRANQTYRGLGGNVDFAAQVQKQ
jgi:Skp family chaperone for outer membrane proteins